MEQDNKTIANKIIDKIDNENLTPISRWHFVLKNTSFWTLWGASVLLGACAIAGAIFSFSHFGWQYRYITHESSFGFLFDALPLFWLISFVGMIAFGYYNLRHTTRGYRFSFALILLVSLFLSFVFGTLLFAIGFGKKLDNLKKPLPFAPPIVVWEEKVWSNDKKGLLSGFIKSFDKQRGQLIISLPISGQEKVVLTSELDERVLASFLPGDHIRIIGTVEGEDFVACAMLPIDRKHGILPPPRDLAERKFVSERSNVCKDVRPYQQYQKIFITN